MRRVFNVAILILVATQAWGVAVPKVTPTTDIVTKAPWVDVRHPAFGGITLGTAVGSSVRAANYTALKAAVLYAVANHLELRLPPGRLEIDLPAASPSIVVTGDVTLSGYGKTLTTLYVGPDANTRSGNLFQVNGGVNALVQDMSILGPATAHTEFDTSSTPNLFWFVGTSGRLDVRRCAIDGGWWQVFVTNSADVGTGVIEVVDSFLHADFQIASIFGNGPNLKSFRSIRTTFYNSGIWSTANNRRMGYSMYIHPGVSILLEDSTVDTYWEGALHHFGTTYDPTWIPEYVTIIGTTVKNGQTGARGGLMLGPAKRSFVDNSRFIDAAKGIMFRGSVDISNTEFIRSANAVTPSLDGIIDGSVIKLLNVSFEDCTGNAALSATATINNAGNTTSTGTGIKFLLDNVSFDFKTRVTSPSYPYAIDTDTNNTTLIGNNISVSVGYLPITNITKANPAVATIPNHQMVTGEAMKVAGITGMTQLAGWSGTVTVVDANNLQLNGVDSTAYSTFTSGTMLRNNNITYSGVQGIRIKNGTTHLQNVTFNGYFMGASLATEGAGVSKLFLDNIMFNTTNSNNLDLSLYHSTAAVVEGQGFSFSGDVSAGFGAGTGNGSLRLNLQINPSTVSSAATVYLPLNYGTHYVNGTTQIATLNLGRSGHIANNAFSGAEVRLIATAGWSLASSGNIIPKNTSARSVNEVVRLIFDATAGKWVEM